MPRKKPEGYIRTVWAGKQNKHEYRYNMSANRDRIYTSLIKYFNKFHAQMLKEKYPTLPMDKLGQRLANNAIKQMIELGAPLTNLNVYPSARRTLDSFVRRFDKELSKPLPKKSKKTKIVPLDLFEREINQDVRQTRKTNRTKEELLVEALLRRGADVYTFDDYQSRNQRKQEIQKVVNAALAELTPIQRVVLWEHAVNGKTFTEIWQSSEYQKVTLKGYTALLRVQKVYLYAEIKFIKAIKKSGILVKKK